MAKMRVSLSIGYPTARHEDVIDVDDDDLAVCETDEERDELCRQYWQDWANNYIDGDSELIDA